MKGWNYSATDISHVIQSNMIAYFDWNFIDQGAIVNVNIPTSGAYGGDFSKLRPSPDPRYTAGKVWEGIRGNWVWESGLSTLSPISISGVYVNNVFTTGNTIDYIRGRVIFNTPIATNSVVRVAHSYKEVQFDNAENHPWLRQLQYRSRRVDESNFMVGSGDYNLLPDNRIQLPYVGVSVIRRQNVPYQLGGGQKVLHTCTFSIIAEDEYSCRKISDMLCNQNNSSVYVFSPDLMINSSAFPLNIDGSLSANPKCYPDLVKPSGQGGFRYLNGIQNGKIYLFDAYANKMQNLGNAWYTSVSIDTETIVTNI